MSGGHWQYLSNKLEEAGDLASEGMSLLAGIEHELDWGISGDTCERCADLRVLAALVVFFNRKSGNDYTQKWETVLTDHTNLENTCPNCIDWRRNMNEKMETAKNA